MAQKHTLLQLRILGITTVSGFDPDCLSCAKKVKALLKSFGLTSTPVIVGYSKNVTIPRDQPPFNFTDFGFPNLTQSEISTLQNCKTYSVDFIWTFHLRPQTVLIALGPLTNIAIVAQRMQYRKLFAQFIVTAGFSKNTSFSFNSLYDLPSTKAFLTFSGSSTIFIGEDTQFVPNDTQNVTLLTYYSSARMLADAQYTGTNLTQQQQFTYTVRRTFEMNYPVPSNRASLSLCYICYGNYFQLQPKVSYDPTTTQFMPNSTTKNIRPTYYAINYFSDSYFSFIKSCLDP